MKFYFKLAFSDIRTNKSVFAPYILSAVGTVFIFYNLAALMSLIQRNNGVLYTVLGLAATITALLAVAFMYYTHSFLMRRRRKEFGLFNILGMEKKHIARLMLHENLIVYVIISVLGIGVGILLNGLLTLLLFNLIGAQPQYSFSVNISSIIQTLVLIGFIFIITMLNSVIQVWRAKPIDLMKQEGEREPKAKIVTTILGIILLAGGYFIANYEFAPADLILRYFVAIILVVVGTYLLFIAGSVAVLKILKKNKNYYYKKQNFLTTSSMMYRMRKNAVGLANICIMSTALIIVIASTLSMYVGLDESLGVYFPRDAVLTVHYNENPDWEKSQELAKETLAYMRENSIEHSEITQNRHFVSPVIVQDDKAEFAGNSAQAGAMMIILEQSVYNEITGSTLSVKDGEIAVSSENIGTVDAFGEVFEATQYISNEIPLSNSMMFFGVDVIFGVLSDADAKDMHNADYPTTSIYFQMMFDTANITQEQEDALYNYIFYWFANEFETPEQGTYTTIDFISDSEEEAHELYGGLFFIGLLLGTLFLIGTVLVMYYKQVAEGMEDKERFKILIDIGLSKKEVRGVIRSQVLRVFFLPIVAAFVHIAFAFAVTYDFLEAFIWLNSPPVLQCMLVTGGVFLAGYAIAYIATSRVYYKIVGK